MGNKYNVSASQRKNSIHASAPGWNEDLATPSEASVKVSDVYEYNIISDHA